jgi:hypothetical protein
MNKQRTVVKWEKVYQKILVAPDWPLHVRVTTFVETPSPPHFPPKLTPPRHTQAVLPPRNAPLKERHITRRSFVSGHVIFDLSVVAEVGEGGGALSFPCAAWAESGGGGP